MKDETKNSKFGKVFKGFARNAIKSQEDYENYDGDNDYESDGYENEDQYEETYEKATGGFDSDYKFDDFNSSSSYRTSSKSSSSDPFSSSTSSSSSSSYSYGSSSSSGSANIYKMNNNKPKLKLSILKLEKVESAVKVADDVINGDTVTFLDLRRVPKDVVRRIIDFLDGVRYTCRAQLEIVDDSIYVLAPKDVELTGDLLSQIDTSNLY